VKTPKWSEFCLNHSNILYHIFRRVVNNLSLRSTNSPKIQAPKVDFDPKTEMTEHFASLFENRKFSDFTIRVAGRDIEVHKSILFTRSSVFGAMLSHDTVETSSNVCEIKDFDYETIYEIIRFIYCGHVENLREMALKLLPAADKVRPFWRLRGHTTFSNIAFLNFSVRSGKAEEHL
jgi:hypothetical protein